MTWDMEKAELVSNFTGKCSSHTTHFTEGKGREWENEELPAVEDQIEDHLKILKMCNPKGLGEKYIHVLREMVDEMAEPLSVIFERSGQSGEVPADSKRGNIASTVKRKTWKTTGQSVPPQYLARAWSRSPWQLG